MGPPLILDPLLGPDDATRMLARRDAFGEYGLYSNEGFPTAYAPGLPQRFDAVRNFLRRGGGSEPGAAGRAAARTNYFRETYAYGDEVLAPGIEPFRRHEGLAEAARALFGRPVVVPAIVFANLYLPGQELAVHTDVPEYRGASRRDVPQWLLVVMAHSGRFERWRMPIATAISFFGTACGGALVCWPDGRDGPPTRIPPRHDTAVVLDTDSVFHGVERVAGPEQALDALRPGMRLRTGRPTWVLTDGERVVGSYDPSTIRFSVSWKAYCFADAADRARWTDHTDDVDLDLILDTLEADLRTRGALRGPRPTPDRFATLLVDEYVRFPGPAPGPAAAVAT